MLNLMSTKSHSTMEMILDSYHNTLTPMQLITWRVQKQYKTPIIRYFKREKILNNRMATEIKEFKM